MKKIILALILGFTAMLHAQQKISGTVTNEKKEPLKGVTIEAPTLHKSTVTDENGQYSLTSLPAGPLKINYSYVGFLTQNKMADPAQQSVLDVVLSQSAFQMDEVIVSTAFNKLQSQNVMKVEHQSVNELRQKGTSTLIEGLATIPGVAQISTGTAIGKPVIRGLSANRVLVYSQGVRLENQQFGDEHGLGLNDSGIESVEIIKGPASLLYGSDAIGGVLYFNPEKFAATNTFKGDFRQRLFSNTLGSSTSLGLKQSLENWKFLVRGSYDTHSDYKIPDGDRVTNTRYTEKDLKVGIGYSNQDVSSVFRYNYNNLDLGIPEAGIAAQSESKKALFPRQGVFNHLLSLNNSFFFKASTLDANIGYIANDRSEFEDSHVASLHLKLQTLNYDLKYHFPKFSGIETIAGVQGMHQTNENSGEEYLIPDATTDDFGVFATSHYQWNKNVVQAGIRYDNRKVSSKTHGIAGTEGYFEALDKSFNSFNASLGYKTELGDNLVLRLNAASGFRAPTLAELTSNGVHEGTNRYEIGNNDLKTEQNVQTDLNLEYNNSHFEFFANAFYNHVNNYIYTSPSGTVLEGNDVYHYIQDNAALYGGEIGLHFHPHPLDWLHFETGFETVTGQKQNGDYLPLIPANNWNNTLRAEFNIKDWLSGGFATCNVSHTFEQAKVSGFETRSNDYTLVNIGLGGKIRLGKTVFEATLNANNLFDKTYIAHLSRLKTDGIPNIGRNVMLGFNFNI